MKKIASTFFTKTAQVMVLCLFLAISSVHAATKMPSFSLADAVNGTTVNSADYNGKTLLITFFATWCPPCMQEVPTLMELHQQFSKANFSVVGLSVDQGGPSIVAKLVASRSINYPVLMADETTARNFGGIAGIPTSFLINKEGNVVKKYPGYVPHAILEKDIKTLMN
ncbi:MAG: TlpA family protein disulfide reductase [Proteobacteria bacterium]|nr:TlpA family protein disulfide reductase [Pseudomonadota bacterium]MBU1648634.1 TlpA family protein disulfide reductase [Pseudomonadota bacterium]